MKPLLPTVVILIVAAGCASAGPPRELVEARSAYDKAAHGPAGQVDPADLHTAKETLDVAQQSYDRSGDTQETKDLAYVAERRAETAAARADTIQSLHDRDQVTGQMNANQTAQVQLTSAALVRANQQITSDQQALLAERHKSADAEQRAAQAAADLARIATVKQEARGMVITLSGSVLFASGKSSVMPAGHAKLRDVANALMKQTPDAKIVVQGYTDSRGSDALNQGLSESRADAVRSELVSDGVPSDRVTSRGFGAADPIADNTSAEGRADNRRVEIVVQPSGS